MKSDSHRQKPSRPSLASARSNTSVRPSRRKSTPRRCGMPLTKTSNGSLTTSGRSTRLADSTLYTMPSAVRRTALATLVTSLAALATATAALAGNGGFLPAEPHSPNAHRINDAFIFVGIFTGIIFLIVEGALIAFVIKYRRGKRPATAEGPQIHGATRLEIIWTVIPVLILAAIGAFVFYKLPGIANAPKAAAADETTISIEGHQFYWLFRYPNGAISINRMAAPANEVVKA